MNEEQLKECEAMVELIMRAMGYGDYDKYNSEEEREKWREFVEEGKNDSVVREQ
jgi:hypothetical protein